MLLKSRMLSYGLFLALCAGACHETNPGITSNQELGIPLIPERSQPGLYTFDNFPDGWNMEKTGRLKEGIANERVLNDPLGERSGKVLEVLYPKGTASPSYSKSVGLKPGGAQFVVDSGQPADGIKLSYWYRFGDGFDCVKGGKLPGVASTGELISGGETPTGTNGFSVRLMWRENCTGEVYAYIPQAGNEHLANDPKARLEKNSTTGRIYGWSLGRGTFSFPQGRWAFVEIEVKANHIGQNDGLVRVAIDSQEVYKRSDLLMRTSDQLKLSRLFFSTFFGGSSSSFATRKDERAYFADMRLTADRSVPDNAANPVWRKANLTNYTSYPDPGSEECLKYNGCQWAGMFAALPDKQPESWVKANNIVAVHSKDFETYKLKTLRLRKDQNEIDVKVYDMCSDSDCDGCCTENSRSTGFLIDIESYTAQRFGVGDGEIEWTCVDCRQ